MICVPDIRIDAVNDRRVRADGRYVLYWMIAARRSSWNFALQRAIEWAGRLRKPLLIFEPLRFDYRWASPRLHRFILDGMRDNLRRLERAPATYFPYVERARGEGRGLLAALARRACCIVTDEFPAFFLPAMVRAAGRRVPVRLERVDSNGLLPMRGADRIFRTAFSFRRHLQVHLPVHIGDAPRRDPFRGRDLPAPIPLPRGLARWRPVSPREFEDPSAWIDRLDLRHAVAPVEGVRGGSVAARRRLTRFLREGLPRYGEARNHPDDEVASGLSPYLHFGHLSVHEVFDAIRRREDWTPDRLASRPHGRRSGWWGLSAGAEAFLDQIVTWREIGFNFCHRRRDFDRYSSLPDWARRTLEKHAADPRPRLYDLRRFAAARTHDPVWNAAQRQLLREGRIHNALRMLWGKKILEWSDSPRRALRILIELNNRYALDGRDPNSYSGIFWTLGRYDRPWGPERPVFGTVRYMSSASARRKLHLNRYLETFGPDPEETP